MEQSIQEISVTLGQMLTYFKNPMKAFTRDTYADNFNDFTEYFKDCLENISRLPEETTDCYAQIAQQFIKQAQAELTSLRKRKYDERMLDYNLVMVAFVLPSLLTIKGETGRMLCDELTRCWKEQFPKTNISAATFAEIDAGFKRRFCYITTAVCESLGKGDECHELTVLRRYRDEYLESLDDGKELILEYYDVAPSIVKHINRQSDAKAIYHSIFEQYLMPCISMIEKQENEQCKELYQKMVYDLKDAYFYH